MTDSRIERMARVLVQYSLNIQSGERLAIRCGLSANPLLEAVIRETLRAGGHPEVFIQSQGVQEILLREGSDEQIARVPEGWRLAVSKFETLLDIQEQRNSESYSAVDPGRKAIQSQAQGEILRTIIQRSTQNSLRWTITLFPSHHYTQDTRSSDNEFEDLFYRACFLEEEDPISHWRQFSQQQERYIARLNGKSVVHLTGPYTDLTFSIQGRLFLNEDGHYNFPGGEFFTGPVEHSVNGSILYNLPTTYGGQELDQIWLRFVEGRVVDVRAQKGQEFLERMLNLDEGARRLGEFAFGNNPFIQTYSQNVLFDEKMEKTVHLALGASIPATRGVNQSSLHWDMVYDLRPGSEIHVDGKLFCKDGVFLL